MKKLIFLMVLFFAVSAFADTYTVGLTWIAPTQNEDGTPLTDLDGYLLYRGPSSGDYTESIDVGDVTAFEWTFDAPEGSRWYYNVTAYDLSRNESVYNGEVDVPFPVNPPMAPVGLDAVVR